MLSLSRFFSINVTVQLLKLVFIMMSFALALRFVKFVSFTIKAKSSAYCKISVCSSFSVWMHAVYKLLPASSVAFL